MRAYSSRELEGGGILVIKVEEQGAAQPVTNYMSWNLDPVGGKATASDHGSERTLSKVLKTVHIQAHDEPFRLELWSSQSGCCAGCEASLQVAMQALLRDEMQSSVSCAAGVASPGGGHACVLSDPIRDTAVAPDEFWERVQSRLMRGASEVLLNSCTAHEDPQKGLWQLGGGASLLPSLSGSAPCWMQHHFDSSTYELRSDCHGSDASLSQESLEMVLHLKVHWRPYRLEMWATSPAERLSGEDQKAFALDLFGPLLDQAEARSQRRKREEQERAMVDEVRKEISSSQEQLREELRALCAEVQELSRERAGVAVA